jgi:hypothetical protein
MKPVPGVILLSRPRASTNCAEIKLLADPKSTRKATGFPSILPSWHIGSPRSGTPADESLTPGVDGIAERPAVAFSFPDDAAELLASIAFTVTPIGLLSLGIPLRIQVSLDRVLVSADMWTLALKGSSLFRPGFSLSLLGSFITVSAVGTAGATGFSTGASRWRSTSTPDTSWWGASGPSWWTVPFRSRVFPAAPPISALIVTDGARLTDVVSWGSCAPSGQVGHTGSSGALRQRRILRRVAGSRCSGQPLGLPQAPWVPDRSRAAPNILPTVCLGGGRSAGGRRWRTRQFPGAVGTPPRQPSWRFGGPPSGSLGPGVQPPSEHSVAAHG